jgi:hypothetical protein
MPVKLWQIAQRHGGSTAVVMAKAREMDLPAKSNSTTTIDRISAEALELALYGESFFGPSVTRSRPAQAIPKQPVRPEQPIQALRGMSARVENVRTLIAKTKHKKRRSHRRKSARPKILYTAFESNRRRH